MVLLIQITLFKKWITLLKRCLKYYLSYKYFPQKDGACSFNYTHFSLFSIKQTLNVMIEVFIILWASGFIFLLAQTKLSSMARLP
jgi:uncharacterized protein (DUF983 family)